MSALVLRGSNDLGIDIAPSATEARDTALSFACTIAEISDTTPAQLVVDTIKELKAIQKSVEDSRVTVKAPVLELTRRIDTVAKAFIGPVDTEVRRLDAILTAYQQEQERIRREAEAKRLAAIRAAQEAEERARREAEAARLKAEQEAAEAAQTAHEQADPFAEAEATAAIHRAAVEAQVKATEAQALAATAIKAATVETAAAMAAPKPTGMSVRRQPDFEVVDLLALANARPDLVTIQPKRAEILSHMRKLTPWDDKRQLCPGLKGWWDGKVVV